MTFIFRILFVMLIGRLIFWVLRALSSSSRRREVPPPAAPPAPPQPRTPPATQIRDAEFEDLPGGKH